MGDHGARQLSALFRRRQIHYNSRTGTFRVDLDDGVRQILRELAGQFNEMLEDPGAPVLHRLFPPAYSDPAHIEHQEEFRRLMQEDLVERHRAEFDLVAETAGAEQLTEEQLLAWTRAINGIRLALGTFLDLSDDGEPATTAGAEWSVYQLLSWILEEAIEALSGQN